MHVDVRVGLVAGDHGRIAGEAVVEVGVHVERHADRHVGGDGADASQQLAFTVFVGLRHHRAVQVEQDAVATGGHRIADPAGDVLERGVLDRAARPGRRGDRDRDLGSGGVGELDERGDRRAGAGIGGARRVAFRRGAAADSKTRERRRHRRVGVRLVLHLGDDELHADLRTMPGVTGGPRTGGMSGF